jgi:hypothetical protein
MKPGPFKFRSVLTGLRLSARKSFFSTFILLGLLALSTPCPAQEEGARSMTAREIWSDSSSLIIARYYFEAQPQLSSQQRSEILPYLMQTVLKNADFAKNPDTFLADLKKNRGDGKAPRFPQDPVIDFLTNLKKKNQLQDFANETKYNAFTYK